MQTPKDAEQENVYNKTTMMFRNINTVRQTASLRWNFVKIYTNTSIMNAILEQERLSTKSKEFLLHVCTTKIGCLD